MRLVSFSGGAVGSSDAPRSGLVVGDEIVDLSDPAVGLPRDDGGVSSPGPGRTRASVPRSFSGKAARYPFDSVRLHAPVASPPTILAIGMNYRAHVAEMGNEPPEYQYWFNKQRTSIAGPGDPIIVPTVSTMVDYEGELAMVIGRRCKNVSGGAESDGSGGRFQRHQRCERPGLAAEDAHLLTLGKSFDSHGAVRDRGWSRRTSLATRVTFPCVPGSTTISGRTPPPSDLIFGCAPLIEYLSTAITLEPGTILATGTPCRRRCAATSRHGFWPTVTWCASRLRGSASSSTSVVQGPEPVPIGLD